MHVSCVCVPAADMYVGLSHVIDITLYAFTPLIPKDDAPDTNDDDLLRGMALRGIIAVNSDVILLVKNTYGFKFRQVRMP